MAKMKNRRPILAPRAGAAPGGSVSLLVVICIVASLAGLLFGFDTAVISGTFGAVEKRFGLSVLQVGWFGSSALVGCVLGALVAGGLGDRWGRKPVLILAAFFFFISALFSAMAANFSILIAARIVGGVGVGLASVLAPLYISEFAPARQRGRLVALYQLSIVIGILAAYFSNWTLSRWGHSSDSLFGSGLLHRTLVVETWRGMFGAEMFPAGLFFVLLLVVPESPRWLVQQGRHTPALDLLCRLNGPEGGHSEWEAIRESVAHKPGRLSELFRPGLRRALLVGVALSVFGQLTGVNIVVYYGPTILHDAGFGVGSALQYQVGLGVINLLATLFAIWKIDRWGRRPLLVGGMGLVTMSLSVVGLLFLLHATAGIWIVLVLSIYMACVALSICAVIWVLTPEIFPNRVRGRGAALATFANWTTNCVSTFLFPWYVKHLGMAAGFFSFAAICLIATFFFWKMVPETRGRTLEEIETLWH